MKEMVVPVQVILTVSSSSESKIFDSENNSSFKKFVLDTISWTCFVFLYCSLRFDAAFVLQFELLNSIENTEIQEVRETFNRNCKAF